MHKRFKGMLLVFGLMGIVNLYGAQPAASTNVLVTEISGQVETLQSTLAALAVLDKKFFSECLSEYDDESLQRLSATINNCNRGCSQVLGDITKKTSVKPLHAAAPSKEADNKRHHDAQAKQGKGSPQVPHLPSVAVAKAAQMYGVPKEQKVKAETTEPAIGADTEDFNKRYPSSGWALRVSYRIKVLAELAKDKTKLAAFKSPKKQVSVAERNVLGFFVVRSNAQMPKFLEYVEALKTGDKQQAGFDKFDVDAIADNAYAAAAQLEEDAADRLILFLDDLIRGIPA